jgi:DNA-binding NarL/FixJ family response regulator
VKTTENLLLTKAKGVDAMARSSSSGVSRRVLRVWVVDDNAALRGLFAQLLTKQPGIQSRREFASAEEVLAVLAEERPPDMILMDVHLGGQSGLSAIRPIKKMAPSVKVLMLTMFSNSHYEAEAFRLGASGFLLKSYGLDEIVGLIHEANRSPGSPSLFPNMALYNEVELGCERTGDRSSSRRFSLVGALQQLCGGPRRQTAS